MPATVMTPEMRATLMTEMPDPAAEMPVDEGADDAEADTDPAAAPAAKVAPKEKAKLANDEEAELAAARAERVAEDGTPPAEEDPVVLARTAAINRQAKRAAEEVKAQKAELAAERTKLEPVVQQAQEFERLKARAHASPTAAVALLRSLGIKVTKDFAKAVFFSADDLDDQTRNHPEAHIYRQGVHQHDALGEQAARIDAIERENKQLREQAAQSVALDAYRTDLRAAATPEHAPLVAKALAKNPANAARVMAHAGELAAEMKAQGMEDDEIRAVLTPAYVVKKYNAALEDLLDAAPSTTTKPVTPAAGKPKSASPTLGSNLTPTTPVREKPTTHKQRLEYARKHMPDPSFEE